MRLKSNPSNSKEVQNLLGTWQHQCNTSATPVQASCILQLYRWFDPKTSARSQRFSQGNASEKTSINLEMLQGEKVPALARDHHTRYTAVGLILNLFHFFRLLSLAKFNSSSSVSSFSSFISFILFWQPSAVLNNLGDRFMRWSLFTAAWLLAHLVTCKTNCVAQQCAWPAWASKTEGRTGNDWQSQSSVRVLTFLWEACNEWNSSAFATHATNAVTLSEGLAFASKKPCSCSCVIIFWGDWGVLNSYVETKLWIFKPQD